MDSVECILWMDKCNLDKLSATKVMLCIRNMFMLENDRDINHLEFNKIIVVAGSAGIVKL